MNLCTKNEIDINELIFKWMDYNFNPDVEYVAVAYGVDGAFLTHAGVSAQSIINQKPSKRIHFIIIVSDISDAECQKFQCLVNGTEHALSIIVISDAMFDILPSTVIFPVSIYYRLLSPLILKRYPYVLYLDADIIALGNLDDLLEVGKPVAKVAGVVREPGNQKALSASVNIPEGEYFNSGVLLVNTERWIDSNVSGKVVNFLSEKGGSFSYFDQDALNIILSGDVVFLSDRFNCQIKTGHTKALHNIMPPKDTVLLHYVGADKPWQSWNKQRMSVFYRTQKLQSPWSNVCDTPAVTLQERKKYYKTLWFNGEYGCSLAQFVSYQCKRLSSKASK